MRPGETVIEMARRHVREAEGHVRKQHEILARLEDKHLPTEVAERLLIEFQDCLQEHRSQLERMLEEQRAGQRDAAGMRQWGEAPKHGPTSGGPTGG